MCSCYRFIGLWHPSRPKRLSDDISRGHTSPEFPENPEIWKKCPEMSLNLIMCPEIPEILWDFW